MNHEDRKDPETLIGPVPESKKGRLKVYLAGAAQPAQSEARDVPRRASRWALV